MNRRGIEKERGLVNERASEREDAPPSSFSLMPCSQLTMWPQGMRSTRWLLSTPSLSLPLSRMRTSAHVYCLLPPQLAQLCAIHPISTNAAPLHGPAPIVPGPGLNCSTAAEVIAKDWKGRGSEAELHRKRVSERARERRRD